MKPIQVISVCSALFLLLPFNVGYISGFLYGVKMDSDTTVEIFITEGVEGLGFSLTSISVKNTGRLPEQITINISILDTSNRDIWNASEGTIKTNYLSPGKRAVGNYGVYVDPDSCVNGDFISILFRATVSEDKREYDESETTFVVIKQSSPNDTGNSDIKDTENTEQNINPYLNLSWTFFIVGFVVGILIIVFIVRRKNKK